jgi:Velvet factor
MQMIMTPKAVESIAIKQRREQSYNLSISLKIWMELVRYIVTNNFHMGIYPNEMFYCLDGGFFLFSDISVRVEGYFRLRFTLFQIVG